jgi:hypothetical protein
VWTVLYDEALDDWQRREHPTTESLVRVLTWTLGFIDFGPPNEHLPIPGDEDLYLRRVQEANVFATYLALGHERLAMIRHFRK